MSNKHVGSSFDDFLKGEGTYDETVSAAVKRVLAWEIAQAMKKKHITKSAMAKRMNTSRTQIDRLLDPDNVTVQLDTIQKAAAVIGKQVSITLSDRRTA